MFVEVNKFLNSNMYNKKNENFEQYNVSQCEKCKLKCLSHSIMLLVDTGAFSLSSSASLLVMVVYIPLFIYFLFCLLISVTVYNNCIDTACQGG